jgi:DNA helicase-2/ATP-dependent DNA helicase PcrA
MSISLNQEQQKAVLHEGSPLLVVAGPGSGKTRVIIERVLHLVENGLKPSEILCLSFSTKIDASIFSL